MSKLSLILVTSFTFDIKGFSLKHYPWFVAGLQRGTCVYRHRSKNFYSRTICRLWQCKLRAGLKHNLNKNSSKSTSAAKYPDSKCECLLLCKYCHNFRTYITDSEYSPKSLNNQISAEAIMQFFQIAVQAERYPYKKGQLTESREMPDT